MDHETAVKVRAAERYVGGELSSPEMEAFEEHFFLCEECAEEVRWEQIFTANLRAALREQQKSEVRTVKEPVRKPWFQWSLRPALTISFALNVAFALTCGYVFWHTLPALRRDLADSSKPLLMAAIAVPTPARGAAAEVTVRRSAGVASFSFAAPRRFSSYNYRISRTDAGWSESYVLPTPAGAPDEVLLAIPTARIRPGDYVVVLEGLDAAGHQEVGRCLLHVTE